MPFQTIRASAQHGKHGSNGSNKAASNCQAQKLARSAPARKTAAYTVAQPKRVDGILQQQRKPSQVQAPAEPAIAPVQQLDDPALWPEQAVDAIQAPQRQPLLPTPRNNSSNPLRLPTAGSGQPLPLANKHPSLPAAAVHGAAGALPTHEQQQQQHKAHRHPPIAPEDPFELLQVRVVVWCVGPWL